MAKKRTKTKIFNPFAPKYAPAQPLLKDKKDILAVINKDRKDIPTTEKQRTQSVSKTNHEKMIDVKNHGVCNSPKAEISHEYNPYRKISADGMITISGRYSKLYEDYDDR